MNTEKLKDLLESLDNGEISVENVMEKLESLPFEDLGYEKVDTHRDLRRGTPEAVYCKGKTETQLVEILEEMYTEDSVLATRVDSEVLESIEEKYEKVETYPESSLAFIGEFPDEKSGKVAIITAGTSDIPVAKKARSRPDRWGSRSIQYLTSGFPACIE